MTHPAVSALATKLQLGYADAEHVLRGQARTDPDAAKAIAEIDKAAEADRCKAEQANGRHSAALGLSMDAVRDAVGKLAADRALLSWFQSRVNRTYAYERPLAHDE